jgi:hypothetical protein
MAMSVEFSSGGKCGILTHCFYRRRCFRTTQEFTCLIVGGLRTVFVWVHQRDSSLSEDDSMEQCITKWWVTYQEAVVYGGARRADRMDGVEAADDGGGKAKSCCLE